MIRTIAFALTPRSLLVSGSLISTGLWWWMGWVLVAVPLFDLWLRFMTISLPIIEEKYLIDPINTPSTYRIAQKFKSLENIQDSSWKFETELYLGKYMFYLFPTSQVFQLICFFRAKVWDISTNLRISSWHMQWIVQTFCNSGTYILYWLQGFWR